MHFLPPPTLPPSNTHPLTHIVCLNAFCSAMFAWPQQQPPAGIQSNSSFRWHYYYTHTHTLVCGGRRGMFTNRSIHHQTLLGRNLCCYTTHSAICNSWMLLLLLLLLESVMFSWRRGEKWGGRREGGLEEEKLFFRSARLRNNNISSWLPLL